MNKGKWLNESGFTLLEVLVTLVILTLVTGLSIGILTTTFNYQEKTQAHVNLRQEANLIVSTLRNQHQQASYDLCSDTLLDNGLISFDELSISSANSTINLNQSCGKFDSSEDLIVTFTLTNTQNHRFSIDTVIEGTTRSAASKDFIVKVPSSKGSYENFLLENIFVYGADFGVFGGTPVAGASGPELGTIFIHNYNQKDLTFTGNNQVTVHRIFIDKTGNQVYLNSSTKLGKTGLTDIVHIKGDVNLNNGAAELNAKTVIIEGKTTFGSSAKINAENVYLLGDVEIDGNARINADTIFIDGNVTFKSSDQMIGNKIHISKNVTFNNYKSLIQAEEVFIGGTISYRQQGNIRGTLKPYQAIEVPKTDMDLNMAHPVFKRDSWYINNGYASGGALSNGKKIFATSHYKDHLSENVKNVVVVSKGDITITSNWNSVSGVLFAPNGKVTYEGPVFEGVVIARDGFFVTNGGSEVRYKNVENFFRDESEFPFE